MSAETRGHTEQGAVEQAAEALRARGWSRADADDILQVFAGLLLSDVDRAVLDAADELSSLVSEGVRQGDSLRFVARMDALHAAVRARRDAS